MHLYLSHLQVVIFVVQYTSYFIHKYKYDCKTYRGVHIGQVFTHLIQSLYLNCTVLDGFFLCFLYPCLLNFMWRAGHLIWFALWQGLGAPVGTMLGGSKDFIQRAVRARKALGGGMRQSGVLAAAGKIALSDMVGRLEEDHKNAKVFAQGDRTL